MNVLQKINSQIKKIRLLQKSDSKFKGYLDKVEDLKIYGWATDATNLSKRLEIEILDGSVVIATEIAKIYRGDVHALGIGDGVYGFEVPIPEILFDGNRHELVARVSDTETTLDNMLSFEWKSAVKGHLSLLYGDSIKGNVKDGGRHSIEVEIEESGRVVATGFTNESGEFNIHLPLSMFDGESHHLLAQTKYPAIKFHSKVIKFPSNKISFSNSIKLDGFTLSGKIDGNLESIEVAVVEFGRVFANGITNESGVFNICLPLSMFDGESHHFRVQTAFPIELSTEKTMLLPMFSSGDLLLGYWKGGGAFSDIPDAQKRGLMLNYDSSPNLEVLVGVMLHNRLFDHIFYQQQSERSMGIVDAVKHFLIEGGGKGLVALPGFISSDYRFLNSDLPELNEFSNIQMFLHYVLKGRQEKRYFNRSSLKRDASELRFYSDFDDNFYSFQADNDLGGVGCCEHYLAIGWRNGLVPNHQVFDADLYFACYESVSDNDIPPYLHYLRRVQGTGIDVEKALQFDSAHIDAKYYRSQLKSSKREASTEVKHYIYSFLCNPTALPDPAPYFSNEYYLRKYPDIRKAKTLPFFHYVEHGHQEGRQCNLQENLIMSGGVSFDPSKPTILLVCHEASRTGAPILGMRLLEHFSAQANVISWNGREGALSDKFAASSVAVINKFLDATDTVWVVRELKRRFSFHFGVINSACSLSVAIALYEEKIPMVALIHEYADYMDTYVVHLLQIANRVVFPAEVVRESAEIVAHKMSGIKPPTNVSVRHQGRCLPPFDDDGQVFSREEILLALGVTEDDEIPAIVLGCGWVQMRKGIECFIETARQVKTQLKRPVRFVWVGGGYKPDTDIQYGVWLRSQIVNSDLEDEVIFFEETVDLDPFFELADVFFLSSRLDPFPNVAIDALHAGVPIVAFERGTGFSEFIHAHPSVGVAVPFLDIESASAAICQYIKRERPLPVKEEEILRLFSFPDYADFVWAEGTTAIAQQERISKESQMIIQSNLMDADFFNSSSALRSLGVLPQYQYVAFWARGIKMGKSRVGFNDKAAESAFVTTIDVADKAITPLANLIRLQTSPIAHDVLVVNSDEPTSLWQGGQRVALHIHAYYIEALPELLRRLGTVGRRMTLYITTNTEEKAEKINAIIAANLRSISSLNHNETSVRVIVTPNRGRDVGPFVMLLEEILAEFDIVGHFHLKGTKQLNQRLVREWQDFLYDSLIGRNGEIVNRLMHAFENDSDLGLLFQEDPNLLGWGENFDIAQSLLNELGIKFLLPENIEYPTGNMFWARTAIFAPLMRRKWEWNDFPAEPVPYDGSILHAIERLSPIVCQQAGFKWATVFNPALRRNVSC